MRHHLFSASQAANTGLATIIGSRPCLERGQNALPLQQLGKNHDIFSFDLGFVLAPMTSEPSGNTTALHAIQVPVDVWHRRMGHVNLQSLRILRDSSDRGINFSDSMSPCDVCAFEKVTAATTRSTPQEGSSSSGNATDIRITYHDEVPPTPGNSATREISPSRHDESTQLPETIATEAQSTGSEQ